MRKSGIELIGEERIRVVAQEGFNSVHDDEHVNGELADAAICYLVDPQQRDQAPFPWPFEDKWWKPSEDRIGELVKAGQFVAAEIDRLSRLEEKQG